MRQKDSLDERIARMEAENFPPDIVGPWKERVAALMLRDELHGNWRAFMAPMVGREQPEYTLDRSGAADTVEDVRYTVRFVGTDQDALITAAMNFDQAYV